MSDFLGGVKNECEYSLGNGESYGKNKSDKVRY